MMNYQQLCEALRRAGAAEVALGLAIELPSGSCLPAHFHITEVGKVTKDFIDCGGIHRLDQTCVLQTLVATDVDHRLTPTKLLKILELSGPLGLADDLAVDVEIQGQTVELYRLHAVENRSGTLILKLQNKQTACLAPDRCGIELVSLGGLVV
jgi:hypothetical protein